MIELIVENFSSKSDICGNRYHKTRITSCRTRESITLAISHQTAGAHTLRKLGFEWNDLHEINHTELPRREFNAIEVANTQHSMDLEIYIKTIL